MAPSDPPAAAPWPWPLGTEDQWSRLRTDASWQATYWVAEWPRCEVGGGFLLPMLLESGLRRVVSVTMAPLPVLAAVRRAERDRTEGTADAELRHRHGFAVTARAVREQESRQQREAELAEGHAGYRYSGYVRVTEADRGVLGACLRAPRADRPRSPSWSFAGSTVLRRRATAARCRRDGDAGEGGTGAGARGHDGSARRRLPVRGFPPARGRPRARRARRHRRSLRARSVRPLCGWHPHEPEHDRAGPDRPRRRAPS